MNPLRRVRAPLAIVAVGLAFVALVQCVRPLPFATTDDNWMYFLPLLKSHTDSLLSGHLLQALWPLGAGWSPWENAQVGIFYLPYHLANVVARALGEPLALLDVSAALHIVAAGLVTFALVPGVKSPAERVAWACLAMVQPGPFLLGLNWHIYLSSYPWFLALALLGLREGSDGLPPRSARLALLACNIGFFLSSHVQMFVLGWVFLVPWWFATAGARAWWGRARLSLHLQLPLLAPLIFMKAASLEGNLGWMAGRDDPDHLLAAAQSAGTVLAGTLWGNLGPPVDFRLWGTAWTGAGMLFSPALALAPLLALWRRRWGLAILFVCFFMFLAAASFPFLRAMGVGPLQGFRWTWKAAILTGPLALLSLASLTDPLPIATRPKVLALGALFLLTASVCVRGMDFDIWPAFSAAHPWGARELVRRTRDFAERAGLPPGARVALVGKVNMVQPLPLPYMGLTGNAPLLSGLETAHIYEPLESEAAAKAHYSLSLPWRQAVPAEDYRADPGYTEDALRAIGVDALISSSAGLLVGAVEHRDDLGRSTYVKRISREDLGYPWASVGGRRVGVERMAGGSLRTVAPSPDAPELVAPRAVSWTRLTDGRWQADPLGPPGYWWVLTFGGAAAALGLCLGRSSRPMP